MRRPPGDAVIDIGCGAATTTLLLADAVGAHGSVLGIDISEPLLAAARRRVLLAGRTNVRLIWRTRRPTASSAPATIAWCRAGVMFFDDPVRAFANLAGAALRRASGLRQLGRARGQSWFVLPLEVAVPRLGPPEPQPPRAPGPLALSEPDYIDEILTAAGFADVRIEQVDTHLPGARSTDEEAELMSLFGPLARLMRERGADEATRATLIAELADRLAPYATADGVRLPAVAHLVTASAPRVSAGVPVSSASRRSASGCRLSVSTGSSRAPIAW